MPTQGTNTNSNFFNHVTCDTNKDDVACPAGLYSDATWRIQKTPALSKQVPADQSKEFMDVVRMRIGKK